jgi:hypothetical protein
MSFLSQRVDLSSFFSAFLCFFYESNETIPGKKERFLLIRDSERVPLTALTFKDFLVGQGRGEALHLRGRHTRVAQIQTRRSKCHSQEVLQIERAALLSLLDHILEDLGGNQGVPEGGMIFLNGDMVAFG